MAHYCCSFVCAAEADCTFECQGCQFQYDCEFCYNRACEHFGKREDEIEWEDEDEK